MYDVIIIGGGPAGLNAALYAGRGGLKALLIEKLFCGGQAATTYEVENYIGFSEPISGPELVKRMETHARRFGVEIITGNVTEAALDGDIKKVSVGEKSYEGKTVILCMGASPKTLGLEREDALRGSGVSYCATCDGAFFRGKPVAVVGGGDAAVEDALYLARFCPKVYLIHRRDQLRATKIVADKLNTHDNIQILWDTVVTSINGETLIEGLSIKNVKTGEQDSLTVDALFVAIGSNPNSELVKGILKLDERGYIVTDQDMATEIPGVFAAGDIRSKPLRQIITAAADGAVAANSAINHIIKS